MTKQQTHATRAAALAIILTKMCAGTPLAVQVQGETNLRASAPTAAST